MIYCNVVDEEKHAHITGLCNDMAPNTRQTCVSYDKIKWLMKSKSTFLTYFWNLTYTRNGTTRQFSYITRVQCVKHRKCQCVLMAGQLLTLLKNAICRIFLLWSCNEPIVMTIFSWIHNKIAADTQDKKDRYYNGQHTLYRINRIPVFYQVSVFQPNSLPRCAKSSLMNSKIYCEPNASNLYTLIEFSVAR